MPPFFFHLYDFFYLTLSNSTHSFLLKDSTNFVPEVRIEIKMRIYDIERKPGTERLKVKQFPKGLRNASTPPRLSLLGALVSFCLSILPPNRWLCYIGVQRVGGGRDGPSPPPFGTFC